MDITQQYRRNIRTFYGWLGSVVLLGLSPMLALWMIRHGTTLWRVAGVMVGASGMLPWMWIVVILVRRGDEFQRRLHLVSIAIASAISLVMLMTLDWLQRARFIDRLDLMVIWPSCLVIWVVTLLATKRYFEKPE